MSAAQTILVVAEAGLEKAFIELTLGGLASILCTSSAEEAVTLTTKASIALFVLSHAPPVLDAVSVLAELALRNRHPIPAIVLSETDELPIYRRLANEQLSAAVLLKPFETNMLRMLAKMSLRLARTSCPSADGASEGVDVS